MSNSSQFWHILDSTPWPILLAISLFFMLSSLVWGFNGGGGGNLLVSSGGLIFILIFWVKDIFREASMEGAHTMEVMQGFKWGMLWFISSEVFFFVSFFWAFFHFSLSPSLEIGSVWPPLYVEALGPFAVPLLNTIVLVGSGVTFTWSHHSLVAGSAGEASVGLFMTILLGLYFTSLQVFEYQMSSFGFNDSVYGSVFFIATGFHGCHVLIGTGLLIICMYRLLQNQFSSTHHIGLEASGWYWHFVDVVWLFLFCCVYWWGS